MPVPGTFTFTALELKVPLVVDIGFGKSWEAAH
jgi:DNA polymerase I-like protein with 3'-5' exonuclease and polymerase domains